MSGRELMVSTFGLGRLRPAPGTWGSLPPAALAWLLLWFGAPAWVYNASLVVVCVAFTLVCLRLGAWAEQHCGKKDPSLVVADETAGQCVALLLLSPLWPALAPPHGVGVWPFWGALDTARLAHVTGVVAAGFVLFRVMDILKPPPAHALQRLSGGLGVVIDDLVAGLYALILLHAGLFALARL